MVNDQWKEERDAALARAEAAEADSARLREALEFVLSGPPAKYDPFEWLEKGLEALHDALDATPAEALAERDAQAWRPIETAPRDGTRVLVGWADGAPLEIAHWQDGSGAFSLSDAWEFSPQPTHWTPLPEPPK